MLKQTPTLPPTVIDQIKLWEQERERFVFTEGVLYNQFLSQVISRLSNKALIHVLMCHQADYETVKNYADQLGVVVWSKDDKRTVVVTKDGHDDVKRYWRQVSKR